MLISGVRHEMHAGGNSLSSGVQLLVHATGNWKHETSNPGPLLALLTSEVSYIAHVTSKWLLVACPTLPHATGTLVGYQWRVHFWARH